MESDLCRRAGRAKNTPYYRFAQQNVEELDKQFLDTILKAKTFDDLDPEMQQFFELCERSDEIAKEMKIRDWLNKANLQKIVDRVVAEIPSEEVSE